MLEPVLALWVNVSSRLVSSRALRVLFGEMYKQDNQGLLCTLLFCSCPPQAVKLTTSRLEEKMFLSITPCVSGYSCLRRHWRNPTKEKPQVLTPSTARDPPLSLNDRLFWRKTSSVQSAQDKSRLLSKSGCHNLELWEASSWNHKSLCLAKVGYVLESIIHAIPYKCNFNSC